MLKIRYLVMILITANILVFYAIFRIDNKLHIVFCDVGQGDGILIYQKSIQILIDGGPDRKMLSCLGKYMPFYDRRIEFVILTNSDLDHYGGLIDILERFEVLGFGTSPVVKDDLGFTELVRALEIEKITPLNLSKGDYIQFGKLRLNTLWPLNGAKLPAVARKSSSEINENSVVLSLEYGAFKSLLTGDIVPPATNSLIEFTTTPVELLKVPHHGSKNGLTVELLETVKPKLAIISSGKNNQYGHPHAVVLEMLTKYGVNLKRTDIHSNIHIVTDGEKWYAL